MPDLFARCPGQVTLLRRQLKMAETGPADAVARAFQTAVFKLVEGYQHGIRCGRGPVAAHRVPTYTRGVARYAGMCALVSRAEPRVMSMAYAVTRTTEMFQLPSVRNSSS